MSSTNPVLSARSAVAHAVRSGDPDAIADARDALAIAKAERLRRDAEALEESVESRRTRLLVTGSGVEPITSKQHAALFATQRAEAQTFLREHPRPPRGGWDDGTQDLWDALLAKHTQAHAALGCPRNSFCRTRQG